MDASKNSPFGPPAPPFRPLTRPFNPLAPPFRPLAGGIVSADFATSQLQGLSISKTDLIQHLCLDVLRHVFETLPLPPLLALSLTSKRFNEWVKPYVYRYIKIPFTPRSNSLFPTFVQRLSEDRDLVVSVRSLCLGPRYPENVWESMIVVCGDPQIAILLKLIKLLTNLRTLHWNIPPNGLMKWCLKLVERKSPGFALEMGIKTVAMDVPKVSCIVNFATVVTVERYPSLMQNLPSYENLKTLQLQFVEAASFDHHPYLRKVFRQLRSLTLGGLWPGTPWEEPEPEHAVDLSQLEELRLDHCSAHWWLNPTLRNLKYFRGTCMPISPGLRAVPAKFKDFLERNTSLETLKVIGFIEYGDLQWLAPLRSSLHTLILRKGRVTSPHLTSGYRSNDLTNADLAKIRDSLPLLRVFSLDVWYGPSWPNSTLEKIIKNLPNLDHLTLRPCQDEALNDFMTRRSQIRSIWHLETLTYTNGPAATLQTTREAWIYFLDKGVMPWDPNRKLKHVPIRLPGLLPPPKENLPSTNFFDEQRPTYEDYAAYMEAEIRSPSLRMGETAWPGYEAKRNGHPREPQVYPNLKTLTLIGGSPILVDDVIHYIKYSCTACRYWEGPEYDLGTADIYCNEVDDIERVEEELGPKDVRAIFKKTYPGKVNALMDSQQRARLLAQYGTTEPKPIGCLRDLDALERKMGYSPLGAQARHDMPFQPLSMDSVLDPFVGQPETVSPGRVHGMRILTKDTSYLWWRHGLGCRISTCHPMKSASSRLPPPDSSRPSRHARCWEKPFGCG